jgi:hypothetical protein
MTSDDLRAMRNMETLIALYMRANAGMTDAQAVDKIIREEPCCRVAPNERPKEQRFKKRR